jgi:hypothetical protein
MVFVPATLLAGCNLILGIEEGKPKDGAGGGDGGSPATTTTSSVGGAGGGCAQPSDCPDTGSECVLPVCTDSTCGTEHAAEGVSCNLGEDVCDGDGSCVDCNETADCDRADEETCVDHVCLSPECINGQIDPPETDVDCGGIDQGGRCPPCENGDDCSADGDCESLNCESDTCQACATDAQCLPGKYCDEAAMVCRPQLPTGTACDELDPGQCESGFCADGFCCDDLCDDRCVACANALTGAVDGQCRAVPQGTDPKNDCIDAPADCYTDHCDGIGDCERRATGSSCGPAGTCSGGVANPPDSCDANGGCVSTATVTCFPYVCNGTTGCHTSCTNNSQCVTTPSHLCDTSTNVCRQQCSSQTSCPTGNPPQYCGLNGSQPPNMCAPKKPVGASCINNFECTISCSGGTCV